MAEALSRHIVTPAAGTAVECGESAILSLKREAVASDALCASACERRGRGGVSLWLAQSPDLMQERFGPRGMLVAVGELEPFAFHLPPKLSRSGFARPHGVPAAFGGSFQAFCDFRRHSPITPASLDRTIALGKELPGSPAHLQIHTALLVTRRCGVARRRCHWRSPNRLSRRSGRSAPGRTARGFVTLLETHQNR